MKRTTKCFVAITLASLCANAAFAQWTIWDGISSPVNPDSGEVLNPTFLYDPADGMFFVENVGPNGIIDSADDETLLGDDIGLWSFLISATDRFVEPVLPHVTDGLNFYDPVYFNAKIQLGPAHHEGFLPVATEPTAIFQLSPNLTADDFRNSRGDITIELGVNLAPMSPGTILFSDGDPIASGAFRIGTVERVPEPGTLSMILVAVLSLLGLRRR